MNCDCVESGEPNEIVLPEGVPLLKSLYLYLSGSCNLACRHCWITPEFNKTSESSTSLPFKYIQSIVSQAKPLGLQSVKLTGGEPLLHPQFKEIVTLVVNEGFSCAIESNGTLIDEDMAHFLASKKNKIFISISLDGCKAETHEDLRGVKGSFNLSINALKYLVKNGVRPQLICTLHTGNKSEIEDVIHLAEDVGCGSVKFNLLQEIGRGTTYKQKFGFTIQESLELYRLVEEKIAPSSRLNICFDIPQAFYPIKRFLQSNVGRCNVLNILGILHTGELSICGIGTSVNELIFGHMEHDAINDVWINNPGLQNLRNIIPDNLKGICYDCIHKNYCLGTCIANNYVKTGELNSGYNFCEEANELGLFPVSRMKKMEKERK